MNFSGSCAPQLLCLAWSTLLRLAAKENSCRIFGSLVKLPAEVPLATLIEKRDSEDAVRLFMRARYSAYLNAVSKMYGVKNPTALTGLHWLNPPHQPRLDVEIQKEIRRIHMLRPRRQRKSALRIREGASRVALSNRSLANARRAVAAIVASESPVAANNAAVDSFRFRGAHNLPSSSPSSSVVSL